MRLFQSIALTAGIATVALAAPALASTPSFDPSTRCSVSHRITAPDQPDHDDMQTLVRFVAATMEHLDIEHTDRGDPALMPRLDDFATTLLIAMVLTRCDHHPRATIAGEAASVYQAARTHFRNDDSR